MSPAQTRLVEGHVDVLRRCVNRFAAKLPPHIDRDELVSAAQLGLVKAAQRFDPGRETSFESYAYTRMVGAMLDALRDQDENGRHDRARGERLLTTRGGERVMAPLVTLVSLSGPAHAYEESASLEEELADDTNAYSYAETVADLMAAISVLPKRHQYVILQRAAGITDREIGEQLGVTESRISQIATHALRRIAPRMAAAA